MQTFKTPLVGSANARSFATDASKDQFCKNALIGRVVNHQSNSATYYVEKRSGCGSSLVSGTSDLGMGVYYSPSLSQLFEIFYSAGSVVALANSSTAAGTLATGIDSTNYFASKITETIVNGITYILFAIYYKVSNVATRSAWYIASDSFATTAYTADGNNSTTITDLKVAGVPSVAGLYVGQKLSAGANIVAGSRIVSINAGAFSAVLDTATTGGAFNDLAITKEPVAKMNDVDFPANHVGGFAEMDGYINIMTADGRAHQSDVNTVSSWNAANYLTCSKYSDVGLGLIRLRNQIAAMSNASIEYLYNAGNAAGSTMSSSDNAVGTVACAPPSSYAFDSADGVVYFVGNDLNLYSIKGFAPERINTFGVHLDCTADGVTPILTAFSYNKKTYLNLPSSIAGHSYWYSVSDDTWSQPVFGAGVIDMPFTTFNISSPYIVFGIASAGNGGQLHFPSTAFSPVWKDNNVAYTMSIQIATDMGTNKRKFATELRLIGDVQASGNLAVSYSDDDGVTFSVARNMALTAISTMKLNRLGSWKGRRLWKFEHSANTPFRAKEIEIDFEVAAA